MKKTATEAVKHETPAPPKEVAAPAGKTAEKHMGVEAASKEAATPAGKAAEKSMGVEATAKEHAVKTEGKMDQGKTEMKHKVKHAVKKAEAGKEAVGETGKKMTTPPESPKK